MSAGIVEPLKELDQLGQDSSDVVDTAQAQDPEQKLDGAAPVDGDTKPQGEQGPSFFIDTSGDQTLVRGHAQPVAIPDIHSSGDESSSSEDIVLFKGRNGARIDNAAPPVSDNITIQVQAVEKTVQKISLDTPNHVKTPSPRPFSPQPWQLRGHDDEDAIFADYVANMSEDNEAASAGDGDGQRVPLYTAFLENTDLGGSDGDVVIADESDSDASDGVQDSSGNRNLGVFETGESTTAEDTDVADEALARLLAKQQELGLDDDELMLLVGNRFGGLQSSTNKTSHPRKEITVAFESERTAKTSRRGPVPSAREVADAFDDLDLMDWGRHNPPRKPKSKRGQPSFDISDSELEETLRATWKADRLRKGEKKQQREELRAQGLLGKNVDPNDPRVKYQTGMTLDQIKEEMRTFLCGTDEK